MNCFLMWEGLILKASQMNIFQETKKSRIVIISRAQNYSNF